MKLEEINNFIQSTCENISAILEVDVTLVNKNLQRIAGTGVFKDKIGEIIDENSVYSKVLASKTSYIMNKEIEEKCRDCANQERCKELADICSPINLNEDILGVLGIAAFNEEQKNKILKKDKDLISFIENISQLISYKLDELYKAQIQTFDNVEKTEIIKAINKYGSNTEGMKKVAKALNIGIATLYRKVKKYNIK